MATTCMLPGTDRRATYPTVIACYEVLDVLTLAGIEDLTEGIYPDGGDNPRACLRRAAYLEAQGRQADYLLDEVHCGQGSRLLDVGCGYGRILRAAEGRGAEATGITISKPQVEHGRRCGLDIRLLNYRDVAPSWARRFDAVVANGSLEHFVAPDEAAAGRDDAVYQEMFAACSHVLSPGGRMATTAIHFREPGMVRPEDLLQKPDAHPRGSAAFHFAMIERSFGGWYPVPGQLERCAAGHFRLVREEDGTRDYLLTSQYWVRRMRRMILASPRVWRGLARTLRRMPQATPAMLRCVLWDQSWTWQFRPPAPTRLLRHTWEAV